ncbi:hypothetical protein D0Y65_015401, partial [Glycine soja]
KVRGVEVNVSRKSYSTQLVVMEDENGNQNSAPPQNEGFLIPNIFTLTILQVDGGSNLSIKVWWS